MSAISILRKKVFLLMLLFFGISVLARLPNLDRPLSKHHEFNTAVVLLILPSVGLQYFFTTKKYLRLDYSTFTTQPSVTQLQPVADNTTNYLLKDFSIHNEFDYILNICRTNGYNTSIPIRNLSVARDLLKNQGGELKFSLMDLLNRNSGISRSVNNGNITDERYNVLQRYFLIGFTYSLNKSGLKT